jgi:hypothetical protein
MLFINQHEDTYKYNKYINKKSKKNIIINHVQDRMGPSNNEYLELSKIYSLTNPYNSNTVALQQLLSLQQLFRKEIDIKQAQSFILPLLHKRDIKNIIFLIQTQELKKLKNLEIEICNSSLSTKYGKLILENIPSNLKFLAISLENVILINNLNNKLISLKALTEDTYNDNIINDNQITLFSYYFPNSLLYFEYDKDIGTRYINKKYNFTNKLEIILLYRIINKSTKQKLPVSTRILISHHKLKFSSMKLPNIIKHILFKKKLNDDV